MMTDPAYARNPRCEKSLVVPVHTAALHVPEDGGRCKPPKHPLNRARVGRDFRLFSISSCCVRKPSADKGYRLRSRGSCVSRISLFRLDGDFAGDFAGDCHVRSRNWRALVRCRSTMTFQGYQCLSDLHASICVLVRNYFWFQPSTVIET